MLSHHHYANDDDDDDDDDDDYEDDDDDHHHQHHHHHNDNNDDDDASEKKSHDDFDDRTNDVNMAANLENIIAFVTTKYGQLLTGPALLFLSVLYWCQFKEYFCGVNINQLKL